MKLTGYFHLARGMRCRGSAQRRTGTRLSLLALKFVVSLLPCLDAELSLSATQHSTQSNACTQQNVYRNVLLMSKGASQSSLSLLAVGKADTNADGVRLETQCQNGKIDPESKVQVCDAGRSASPQLLLAGHPPAQASEVSSECFSETPHLSSIIGLGKRDTNRALWPRRTKRQWMAFEEARNRVRSLAYTRRADFWAWWKRERPRNLPYNPDKAYRYERRWLGASVVLRPPG